MAFQFTPAQRDQIEQLCARYPTRRAALLPVLWIVQAQEGWVSAEAMEAVAQVLDITPAAVYEVVTFYTMYERRPCARHHLQVCRTLSCWLRGAKQLTKYLEGKLGVRVGGQTPDGRFQLSEVECLGSCGTAPMMQVNGRDYYENLTPEQVDKLLDALK
ncbi:MAG: NADH-quinone oxidoreductase subunit NuoE [Deltaproteobacteria bacterium]|nr:NADH-quinone oxidoreductase subunit NuoE [Deltaproteobacteria bacterium]